MKRPRKGSTIKQVAYATRMMNGQAGSKKEAALLSGFSMSVAENAKVKIEDTEGYQNAIIGLATESGNLLQAVMAEFKARGINNFSNADLIKAMNAIAGAWEKIENRRAPNKLKTPEGNPLRGVLMQRVETQTAYLESSPSEAPVITPSSEMKDAEFEEEDPMDF